MYAPRFQLRSFDRLDLASRETVIRLLLEALITANIAFLRSQPHTPWLYESGVVYEEEEDERDDWNDIPETYALRVGDCEDLAAWRVAELRARRGEHAIPRVSVQTVGLRTKYHVTLRRADGQLEDPSRLLGMR